MGFWYLRPMRARQKCQKGGFSAFPENTKKMSDMRKKVQKGLDDIFVYAYIRGVANEFFENRRDQKVPLHGGRP